MKPCKDCKHFSGGGYSSGSDYYRCGFYDGPRDPVLGTPIGNIRAASAYDERSQWGKCGPEGKRWEAK